MQRLGRKTQFSGTNQKSERRRLFGTSLVKHCPQGLFSPFFTFLCAIFSHPFRPSLAPTIRPWVSEDHLLDVGLVQVSFHAMYLHLLLQCASWLKKILVISDGHPVSSVGKAPLYQTRGCRFKPWPYILRQYIFL